MNDKLCSILTLALRPETGDGEAHAAFYAARRLAAKGGIDNIFGVVTETKTKTVYKDRVVNRDRFIYRSLNFKTHTVQGFKLTVPANYLHAMVHHLFKKAYELDVRVDVVSCRAKDDKVAGAAIFELKLEGRAVEIDEIKHFLHRAVKAINEDNKPAYPEDTAGISLIDVDDRKRGRIVTFIKKLAEKL